MGERQLTREQMLERVAPKVEKAIERQRAFEPEEGYYLAFSGGKDSQCAYHLAKMAGVKFDAHYAVTSVDPPELVRFIKEKYPDVQFERQHDENGKPITMWSLIASHTLPPTRKVRYCCSNLKEPGGAGRIVVTGVRWAESVNRKTTHDVVDFQGKPKRTQKLADQIGADYKLNKHGNVILNDDNDENRRLVEQCYRTRKTMVNPIVDWTDEDVWDFLNGSGIEHCCLYDEGFKRQGCIGCPLAGSKNMVRDFHRWPKYRDLYIMAFERMIENHAGEIKALNPEYTKYSLDEELADTKLVEALGLTELLAGTQSDEEPKLCGGGQRMGDAAMVHLRSGWNVTQSRCSSGGSRSRNAEKLFVRWVALGAC